jgi:hypothetical protein
VLLKELGEMAGRPARPADVERGKGDCPSSCLELRQRFLLMEDRSDEGL